MLKRTLTFALLFLGLKSAHVHATQVLNLDLEALCNRSSAVVLASVLKVASERIPGTQTIITRIELGVDEDWTTARPGWKPLRRLTIQQLGGVADGVETTVIGMPRFVVGQRALLFVRTDAGTSPQSPEARFGVVGMMQGFRPLFRDAVSGHWMVMPSDKSEAVHPNNNRVANIDPGTEAILRVDELKGRVVKLLGMRKP
ncbi:MAG: hypothetical protein SGI86_10750 [Deltaproteobacteria bacterium]|nr:hypothetical protein [Deltaproteobacteria bacterium]